MHPGWTAAIDEAGKNFRLWYSLITVLLDLANLSIQVLQNYIVNLFTDVLNIPLK